MAPEREKEKEREEKKKRRETERRMVEEASGSISRGGEGEWERGKGERRGREEEGGGGPAEAGPSASELSDGGKRPLLRPLFCSKQVFRRRPLFNFERNRGWSGGLFPPSNSSEADGSASATLLLPPSFPLHYLFSSLPPSKSIAGPPMASVGLCFPPYLPLLSLFLSPVLPLFRLFYCVDTGPVQNGTGLY